MHDLILLMLYCFHSFLHQAILTIMTIIIWKEIYSNIVKTTNIILEDNSVLASGFILQTSCNFYTIKEIVIQINSGFRKFRQIMEKLYFVNIQRGTDLWIFTYISGNYLLCLFSVIQTYLIVHQGNNKSFSFLNMNIKFIIFTISHLKSWI